MSKNYVFIQDHEKSKNLKIYNVSEVNSETGDYETFDIVLHQKKISNNSNLQYYFQKNNFNSFYIIVKEKDENLANCEITSYEIIIPSKKGSDFLSNLRFPL